MRLTPRPQSLFGRLIAATVLGVLLAQAATLYLFARNGQRIFVQATTGMWARHIAAVTLLLERLPRAKRAEALKQLRGERMPFGPLGPGGPPGTVRARALWLGGTMVLRSCADAGHGACVAKFPGARGGLVFRQPTGKLPRLPGSNGPPAGAAQPPPGSSDPTILVYRQGALAHARTGVRRRMGFERFRVREAPLDFLVRLPFRTDEHRLLMRRLRDELGKGYHVEVTPATAPAADVIRIPGPMFQSSAGPGGFYDVAVRSAGHAPLLFRVARLSPVIPVPRSLILNLVLLVVMLVVALYVATRGITRPLSRIAKAAEAIGQGGRAPQLPETGARELRHAARAFNTMQDRLHRYLDSRTRVLAAMSHDLKTPLTRLRLQVETLIEDEALRARFGRELDEMESMVHGALALFRGLNEQEPSEPVDVDALIESVREGFASMGERVTVSGRALAPFSGRPQALKRCLTNLVANAVKFGNGAEIAVQDGEVLRICVRDTGPGIAPEELERVFEPFYRLESSRNRDTGGTGLGLSIARDVAQAHGGKLVLSNRPQGGLEAELSLPRRRN